MTYCAKCGTKNDDDSTFCIKCGASLIVEAVKKNKFDIKKGAIIIIGITMILFASFFIFIFNNHNINRYSNTENTNVVSDNGAIVVSDRNIQIASNQETEVSISSIPPGVNIYINNISRGKTPAKINLTEGKYSLRMNISGYKSIISDFNVTTNQDTEIILNTTLEPEAESTNLTNGSTTNLTNG